MSPQRPLPRPTPTVAALLSSVQTPRHTARPSERCGNMAPGKHGPPRPGAAGRQLGPCPPRSRPRAGRALASAQREVVGFIEFS